ncbi:DUF1000-domain-containing protein [Rickenella mellea]|uniref:DUF1000-domain-containing protein n=1 Tax=Rickenella mellea TaxID=50990 RepID=A0A4Y7Q564_9AGAM|nr:DUF1000-domain-containing protein [Rickenella mellea]
MDHVPDSSNASEIEGSGATNLYSVIDRQSVHGLGLDVPESAKAVIKPWDERDDTAAFAESIVDDQLVIHVPFVQSVRVRSILLKLGRGEVTPTHLRVYTNHPHIVDFADADATAPQLNISLLEGQTGVTEYPFRSAAFANVNSMSLHFGDSVGEEVSRVYYIGFKGETKDPQKESTSKLEVPAANAGEARLVDKAAERNKNTQGTAR